MVPVMANIRPMKRVPGDTNLSCTETAPGGGDGHDNREEEERA